LARDRSGQGQKNLDFSLLDTGHFALEERGDVIAEHIRRFVNELALS
jgi:hypothetical protein